MVSGDLGELKKLVSGNHPPIADLLTQPTLSAELPNTASGDAQGLGRLVHANQR